MQVMLNMRNIDDRLYTSLSTALTIKKFFDGTLPIEVIGTLHNYKGRDIYLVKGHVSGASAFTNINILYETNNFYGPSTWKHIHYAHTREWVKDNYKKENLFWLDIRRAFPVNNKSARILLTNFDD